MDAGSALHPALEGARPGTAAGRAQGLFCDIGSGGTPAPQAWCPYATLAQDLSLPFSLIETHLSCISFSSILATQELGNMKQ